MITYQSMARAIELIDLKIEIEEACKIESSKNFDIDGFVEAENRIALLKEIKDCIFSG